MRRVDEVRWGILGSGAVTEKKSGPALRTTQGSRLVAVMRRTPGLARDYAERHGVPRWYESADELVADPEVNAVYVATPPGSHAELALLAARAGKPAYVEKPMAASYAECRAMIEAFERAGVPLFVAYYRRALPRFQRVKELLDAGAIGAPRTVEIALRRTLRPEELRGEPSWRVMPEIAGGGHFVDLASHTLDLLDWLLGPIAEARGLAGNQAGLYAAEDVVATSLRFESGVLGAGAWTFAAHAPRDRVVIAGSRGELRFATFADEPIVLATERGEESFAIPQPDPIQGPMIARVVAALLGVDPGGDAGTCDGETAARTTRVMESILGGHAPGRQP